jgi:GNAT superfamily N-acetyltransferase
MAIADPHRRTLIEATVALDAGGMSMVTAASIRESKENAASAAPPFHVRRADHDDPRDRAVILAILREYFATIPGGGDGDARYRWLYLDNPSGKARTYLALASATGEAVGITSLFPRTVQVAGERATGAIGGDAFVTPSFRRRGIVTQLHRLAYEDLDRELAFMFGPPEPNNLRALLQAGAEITGSVRRYTRALRAKGLGRGATRFPTRLKNAVSWFLGPPRSKLTLEALDGTLDTRVTEVWEKTLLATREARLVVPVRDAAFYAWRFGRSPSGRQLGYAVLDRGKAVGVVALERSGGRVGIVDLTCPAASFRAVLRGVLHACKDADAVEIQIHVPSRIREANLASLGFLSRGTKPFQVQFKETYAARDVITRADAWNYMWGDGDVDHVL